jgi:uncharacterized membrane protein
MTSIATILSYYILSLGIALIILCIVQLLIPERIYSIWKKWISHRFFRAHGAIIMIGGLPLTFFREGIAGKIMLCIGLFVVFMGPFILLFPNKMRDLYIRTESDIEEEDKKGIIYFDALTRGISGAIFVYTIFRYGSF